MNSVGIDISKGRSTVTVMRPFGEAVISPFEVRHTDSELSALAGLLKSLNGETRVVMEATGNYHTPVARVLHDAGLYVSVVNAKLVHGYGNNDLRRVKTARKDAVKLANYGLDRWLALPKYIPEEDTRLLLKNCYRQYRQYSKVQTVLKNNLISLSVMEQLSFLFNEAEVYSAAEKETEENITVVAAHKRHKKHEYTLDSIPEGIETRQVEHRLEGEDLVCPQCGDTMAEIGKEVARTLEIIPAQTIVREDIYYAYACKNSSNNADEGCETPVVKAPLEKNIIPGSFATPEAIPKNSLWVHLCIDRSRS